MTSAGAAQDFDRIDERTRRAWSSYDLPVEPRELRAWLVGGRSLIDEFAGHAAASPGKIALCIDGQATSYGDLAARSARLAAWLRDSGATPGSRVLIVGQNSTNLIVACLAAMWSGGVELVANPALTASELQHVVQDARPAVVLADAAQLDEKAAALGRLPCAVLDARGDERRPGIDDVVDGAAPGLPAPRLAPDATASVQYTSGTTGRPKGAVLTHGNVLAHLRSLVIAWGWRHDDVLCHSLPLAHGHGRNGVFTALLTGATAVVLPRTDPERIAAELTRWSCTVFYSVPAIWERMLSWDGFSADAFRSVRLFTSGSAPLSPAASDRVAEVLGKRPLERYGTTETGVSVTHPLDGTRHAGTVGIAVPGTEVRVTDAAGTPVPDGEVGEIIVRGPAVFGGYWELEDADAFHGDGWFRTGDLGRFDPERDGHLVITGRSKEMIVTGGLNVYPREVELVAEGVAGVREAVVVGIPSQQWGEQVVMAVVPEDRSTAFDVGRLLSEMRGRLAGYKMPKACKVVSEVPRNHMGKPLRGRVSEEWAMLPETHEP
jgi:malonyl-CoA/methylmalonyl-CoA synthetase